MSKRYLFYIAQNYAYEILRPLQRAIWQQSGEVAWFLEGNEVTDNLLANEQRLGSIDEVIKYNPRAVFVPGNLVPNFIPGLKVQVFHGLEWKKKGHFGIRGCFDLYCTHGPATTTRFNELAKQHGYFSVIETGWPKLDTLFSTPAYDGNYDAEQAIILFAPTFSPSLTAAPALFDTILALSHDKPWQWLVKFHPKMATDWVNKYKQHSHAKLKVIEDHSANPLLQAADIMISDTSSIIGEFALLGKPAITLNNSQPDDYLINITQTEQLAPALTQLLATPDKISTQVELYAKSLHPYQDGKSSERIIAAVEHELSNPNKTLKAKPRNVFRHLKMRKKLNYWRW